MLLLLIDNYQRAKKQTKKNLSDLGDRSEWGAETIPQAMGHISIFSICKHFIAFHCLIYCLNLLLCSTEDQSCQHQE